MSYTTREAIREMNRMEDLDVYPDTTVDQAIGFAKTRIDRYTGTSFGNIETAAYDPFEATVGARGRGNALVLCDDEARLIVHIRSITGATLDGVTVDATGWNFTPTGRVWTDTTLLGNRLTITGTAGLMDKPDEVIEWAARTLARNHLLNNNNSIPDRAIEQAGEFGPIRLAQPSLKHPTGIPAVDAALMDYRQTRSPVY